tara:strand:+ start:462 stop:1298 length:837 start_codon:yes stop_codon:yes gene_type:complete
MAKKKTQETTDIETVVAEKEEIQVVEKAARKEPSKKIIDGWEIKDRMYRLKNGISPLTYTIGNRNLFYYDEEQGFEREVRYAANQNTPFVDEFLGQVRLEHVVFVQGGLFVPKEKSVLQKFLTLYHPKRNKLYEEVNKTVNREREADVLEFQLDAMNAANSMDIMLLEAIMRVEIGSGVSKMSSKELKRDGLLFARNNPRLFLELANDENIQLRNTGIVATESGILKLSNDNRTFSWGNTGRKLMTVPFDEHPYSALAHWFKTDEGMDAYKNIEKRLK